MRDIMSTLQNIKDYNMKLREDVATVSNDLEYIKELISSMHSMDDINIIKAELFTVLDTVNKIEKILK
jgi:prefoldin subunit 5